MSNNMIQGIRKSSAIITIAVLATPEVLFQRTTGASGNTVARTVGLKKIWCWSAVGNAVMQIGTGLAAAFAQAIPPFNVPNGVATVFNEDDIPYMDLGADLTCQCDTAGVLIMVECEERSTEFQIPA